MELVYLWVEDYKNIQKQGFNFSPRFNCHYNEDKNELTIDENDDYIENFFGENINVTAIVGKNGSGKTSLLNLITSETTGSLDGQGKYLLLYYNKEFILEVRGNKFEFWIKPDSLVKVYYQDKFITVPQKTIKDKFIFLERMIYNEDIEAVHHSHELGLNLEYKSDATQKMIDFSKNKKIKLEVNTPKELKISFYQRLFTNLEANLEKEKYHKFLDYIYKMIENSSDFWKNLHIKLLLSYMFSKISKNKQSELVDLIEPLREKFVHKNKLTIDEVLDALKEEILEDEMKTIDNFLIELKKGVINEKSESIKLSLDIVSSRFIANYQNSFKKALKFELYPYLSHGEYIFIMLFANLYNKLAKEKEDILLVIDEGETTLHPQWQKKYIKLLIKYLDDNFSDLTFHIVLATHSPFLLSDIPKQNIIFLDKDKKGNCKVVDGLKEKKQTFGANIHILLSDSFFMEDGLMGEFAKKKINEIIDFFNNKNNIYEKDKEKLLKIINTIGEAFLKEKLLSMYNEKYPKTKEEEIRELKAKLKRLENG